MVTAVCLTGCGQKAAGNGSSGVDSDKVYQVGVCQLTQHDALDAATQGFVDALNTILGSEHVNIDVQVASGDSTTCTPIVNSFVNKKVDLIMANATPALQAAYNATTSIPILGTSVTEYGVALGLSDFSGTVGGNISGTSDLAPLTEQADMILELVPQVKTVGLLYCSAEPNSEYQVKVVEDYLSNKGLTCTRYSFSDSNDVAAVTTKAAADSDVIYIPTDNTAASCTETIGSIVRSAKTPLWPASRVSAPAAALPPSPSATTIWATRPAKWPLRSSRARRISPRCPLNTLMPPSSTTPICARSWASPYRRATPLWRAEALPEKTGIGKGRKYKYDRSAELPAGRRSPRPHLGHNGGGRLHHL